MMIRQQSDEAKVIYFYDAATVDDADNGRANNSVLSSPNGSSISIQEHTIKTLDMRVHEHTSSYRMMIDGQ